MMLRLAVTLVGVSAGLLAPAAGLAAAVRQEPVGPLDAGAFADPDASARPTALWFWNGTVTAELIDRQLAEMRAEGIDEVALFPFKSFPSPPFREGVLQPPFFSDGWFALVEHTLREAERRGMRLWLFNDEYWPSGWGAGLVVNGGRVGDRVYEPRPDLRAQELEREVRTVAGPVSLDLADVDAADEVVAVAALPVADGQARLADVVDLTDEFRKGERWDAPAGQWRIEYYRRVYLDTLRNTGVGYPDLLNPEAVERFIDAVQGEYHRRFPWAFGTVLRGFWDDEPNIPLRAGEIPWSHALPQQLQASGRSPAQVLPALFDDHGRPGRVLRGEFWRAVLTLHAEAHYRLQAEWAENRRVEMVSNPFSDQAAVNFGLGGDNARNYQWSQVPGGDAIFEQATGARTLIPRLAASAAHQNGRARALSENFGGSGWGVTPQRARSTLGTLAARGMNLAVLHAYWLDPSYVHFPPPLDPSSTWWFAMDELTTWTGRVMEANQGRATLETAVLQPQRAAEAWYRTGSRIGAMQEGLENAAFALEEAQVDFDLLSESYLDDDPAMRQHADVRGGRIHLGPQRYRVLVLPPAPTMSLETVQRLTELARSGGTVVAYGALPTEDTRGRDAQLRSAVTELFGTDPADPQPGVRRHGAGSAAFTSTLDELRQRVLVAGAAAAELMPARPAVRVLRRERGGDRVFLVVNEGEAPVKTTAVFPERGTPELWDPDDGTHRTARDFGRLDRGVAVPLRLAPSEVVVVAFRRAGRSPQTVPHLVNSPLEAQSVREDGPQRLVAHVVAERPGTYPLVGQLGERTYQGTAEVDDPLEPIELGGPWRFRFELPDAAWLERPLGSWTAVAPGHSGRASYETTVTLSAHDLAPGRRMLLDLGEVRDVAEVAINGQRAGRRAWEPYRLDITDRLHPGTNRIRVQVANTPANARGSAQASGLLGPVTLRPFRTVEAALRRAPHDRAVAIAVPERLTFNPGQTRTVAATIANYAPAPVRDHLVVDAEPPIEVQPDRVPLELAGHASTTVELHVSIPPSAPAGTHALRLRAGDATATVTVDVEKPNLAREASASASSTHPSFRPEWAINGDRSSTTWSQGNGWNDNTRDRFPDWLQLTFPEPETVERVDLYTLDSDSNPARGFGLRDWDIEVLVGGEWHTVAEVRGNDAGFRRHTFEPIVASAVRVVARGANDGHYSRIVELEVY